MITGDSMSSDLPITRNILKSKFYGVQIKGKQCRLNEYIEKVNSIEERFLNRGSDELKYRVEFRWNLDNIELQIKNVCTKLLLPKNFISIRADHLIKSLARDVLEFNNGAVCGFEVDDDIDDDIDDLYNFRKLTKTILGEHIFQSFYCGGNDNCTFLGPEINSKINSLITFRDDHNVEINFSELVDSIYLFMNDNQKREITMKYFKYAAGSDAIERTLYTMIADSYYSNNSIKALLDCLCIEATGDIYATSNVFAEEVIYNSTISIDKTVEGVFNKKDSNSRYSLTQLFYLVLIDKYKDGFISELLEYLGGLKWIYNANKSAVNATVPKYQLIATNMDEIKRNRIQSIFEVRTYKSDLNKRVMDEELVRFLSAFLQDGKGANAKKRIAYNFAYGFFPARNEDWVKNRIRYLAQIFKTKEIFEDFILKVINWDPSCFNMRERYIYLGAFDTVLNDKDKEM